MTPSTPKPGPDNFARRFGGVPVEAVLIGLGLFALLAVFVAADPASRVTFSLAPFTDEGLNLANSRNLVQLGTWSVDSWTRHLVELPFAILEAAWLKLVGVGIVQARLLMIACIALTATSLVWGLRSVVGRTWAIFGGLAFACSGLILFYGRLIFFENLMVLGLTLGTMALVRDERLNFKWGVVSGVCFAIAIGTKPSAAFAVAGILFALCVAQGWRDVGLRRWVAGTVAAIAVFGLLWAAIVWLPNRDAVAIDIATWPALDWQVTPAAFVHAVRAYATTGSDGVLRWLLLPLVVLAIAGVVAIVALRHRLGHAEARLAVAAFGWASFSFAVLVLASYHPNRYAVPVVPALAILAAIGFHLTGGWLTERASAGGRLRGANALLAVVAIVVAVGPGLNLYRTWMTHANYDLVAIQNRFQNSVPAGERVAGRDVALFFMTSKNETTITNFTNLGNLYIEGVRYYLVLDGQAPPNGVPPDAWAARRTITCAKWNATTECLVQVR